MSYENELYRYYKNKSFWKEDIWRHPNYIKYTQVEKQIELLPDGVVREVFTRTPIYASNAKCWCCDTERPISCFTKQKHKYSPVKTKHFGYRHSSRESIRHEDILNGEALCDICRNEIEKLKSPLGMDSKIIQLMVDQEMRSNFRELIKLRDINIVKYKKSKRNKS